LGGKNLKKRVQVNSACWEKKSGFKKTKEVLRIKKKKRKRGGSAGKVLQGRSGLKKKKNWGAEKRGKNRKARDDWGGGRQAAAETVERTKLLKGG